MALALGRLRVGEGRPRPPLSLRLRPCVWQAGTQGARKTAKSFHSSLEGSGQSVGRCGRGNRGAVFSYRAGLPALGTRRFTGQITGISLPSWKGPGKDTSSGWARLSWQREPVGVAGICPRGRVHARAVV